MNRCTYWTFLGLFLFLLVLLAVKLSLIGWSLGSDSLSYYAHLRSFAIDYDFDYTNEFRDFNPRNHAVPSPDAKTATGLIPNKFPIGPALLWTPFFLLAHGLTWLGLIVGFNLPANGYSILYQLFIGLGAQLYGLCGLYLIYRLLRLFYPLRHAILSVVVVSLSTNVVYYLTVESTMSHSFSLFAVALFIYFGTKTYRQKSAKQFFAFGLMGALMTLIRYQNGLFMLFPLLELADQLGAAKWSKENLIKAFGQGIVFLSGFLLGLIPQALVWKIIYGDLLLNTYGKKGFETKSHYFDILFSLNHGLIAWTPIILLCLLGLAFFIVEHRKLGLFFLLFFLAQYHVNANWHGWSFGVSFSSRAFVNCTFVFCAGMAAILARSSRRMKYVVPVLLGFVVWNFLLIIQYALGYLPLQGDYSWGEILENQILILKDMVHLLWSIV